MRNLAIILSSGDDIHATAVAHEIKSLGGRCKIIDLSIYPERLRISQEIDTGQLHSRIRLDTSQIDQDDICGVWYRRPGRLSAGLSNPQAGVAEWADRQVWHGIHGWLETVQNVINPPDINRTANIKAVQLAAAAKVGLSIPRTLISNDETEVRRFWEAEGGSVIFKGLASHPEVFWETRLLTEETLRDLHALDAGPSIFQQCIAGKADYRITVIDDDVFSTRVIPTGPAPKLDWRMDNGAGYEICETPLDLHTKLLQLHKLLGLRYGAYDFKEDNEGQIFFLEVNPGGQFLFNDVHAGTQISAAVAKALLGLA